MKCFQCNRNTECFHIKKHESKDGKRGAFLGCVDFCSYNCFKEWNKWSGEIACCENELTELDENILWEVDLLTSKRRFFFKTWEQMYELY